MQKLQEILELIISDRGAHILKQILEFADKISFQLANEITLIFKQMQTLIPNFPWLKQTWQTSRKV